MWPTFLSQGGWMIWVIVLASAIAIVVFIERVLHYHRAQINSMEFLNGVRNVLKRDNFDLRCHARPRGPPGKGGDSQSRQGP
jgi:biopolymer transport protein ExbB/TolQ